MKKTTLLLIAFILFQGCTAYKSANVTLEDACKSQTKVKIKTNDNQTLKYLNITQIHQEYFGVKKVNGDLTNIPIQKDDIESVRIKDKTMSAIGGVLTGLGALVVAVGIAGLIGGGFM